MRPPRNGQSNQRILSVPTCLQTEVVATGNDQSLLQPRAESAWLPPLVTKFWGAGPVRRSRRTWDYPGVVGIAAVRCSTGVDRQSSDPATMNPRLLLNAYVRIVAELLSCIYPSSASVGGRHHEAASGLLVGMRRTIRRRSAVDNAVISAPQEISFVQRFTLRIIVSARATWSACLSWRNSPDRFLPANQIAPLGGNS